MDRPTDPADSAPAAGATAPAPRGWLARWGSENWDRLLFDLMLVIPAIWLIGYLWPPINADSAQLLNVSDRWLQGDVLYRDIMDVNTPAVFMIYAVPQLLARATGLGAETWLTLCVFAAIALSFVACRRLIHLTPSLARPLTETLVPPTLLFVMAVLPSEHFCDREHLMLIAGLPYVFLAAARAEGVAVRWPLLVPVALCAGVTLAQKPYFLAVPALVETWLLTRRGWRATFSDPTPWIVGGASALHLALVLTVFSEYIDFVRTFVLAYYSATGETTWGDVLFGSVLGPTLLALTGFGLLALLLTRTVAAPALVCFSAGAAIAAAAQAKGWYYHVYPALAAGVALGALALAQVVDRYLPLDRGAHRRPVAAISAVFLILLFFQAALFKPPFQKQRQYDDSLFAALMHMVGQHAPNKKILVLSGGIYPLYPLINYAGLRMTMRFQGMWVLQGVYGDCEEFPTLYNTVDLMSDAERFVYDTVAEDFAREAPDLVIVDRVPDMPRCLSKTFDYLEYFMRNPTFARAFDRYTPLMELDRYSVYRRK